MNENIKLMLIFLGVIIGIILFVIINNRNEMRYFESLENKYKLECYSYHENNMDDYRNELIQRAKCDSLSSNEYWFCIKDIDDYLQGELERCLKGATDQAITETAPDPF